MREGLSSLISNLLTTDSSYGSEAICPSALPMKKKHSLIHTLRRIPSPVPTLRENQATASFISVGRERADSGKYNTVEQFHDCRYIKPGIESGNMPDHEDCQNPRMDTILA